MLNDGLELPANAPIKNLQIEHGPALPTTNLDEGELFYLNAGAAKGLYVVDNGAWVPATPSQILISVLKSDVDATITALWGFSRPLAVPAPVGEGDATNKAYVDLVAKGLLPHVECAVATTAEIVLSGLQAIDGYTTLEGDRVLVKSQANASQNGVYVASAGAWARASDFDGSPTLEVRGGDFLFVQQGTAQANTGWVLLNKTAITVGTTPITFGQVQGVNTVGLARLDTAQVYTKAQRGAVLPLTPGNPVAIDLGLSNNFSLAPVSNFTLSNPTNMVPGQSGLISIKQDATGGRTITFDSQYVFQGGVKPVLSTAANATDYLSYYVESATRVFISAMLDVR